MVPTLCATTKVVGAWGVQAVQVPENCSSRPQRSVDCSPKHARGPPLLRRRSAHTLSSRLAITQYTNVVLVFTACNRVFPSKRCSCGFRCAVFWLHRATHTQARVRRMPPCLLPHAPVLKPCHVYPRVNASAAADGWLSTVALRPQVAPRAAPGF